MPESLSILVDDARPSGRGGEIDAEALVRLARATLRGEGVARASISVVIVDDATIRDLNRRTLRHDWPTDVITFPLSDPDDEVLEAELVLSAEMAEDTAREVGATPGDELALYLVHGLLHLCGFDDRSEAEASLMRRREDEVLRREGYANPYGLIGRGAGS